MKTIGIILLLLWTAKGQIWKDYPWQEDDDNLQVKHISQRSFQGELEDFLSSQYNSDESEDDYNYGSADRETNIIGDYNYQKPSKPHAPDQNDFTNDLQYDQFDENVFKQQENKAEQNNIGDQQEHTVEVFDDDAKPVSEEVDKKQQTEIITNNQNLKNDVQETEEYISSEESDEAQFQVKQTDQEDKLKETELIDHGHYEQNQVEDKKPDYPDLETVDIEEEKQEEVNKFIEPAKTTNNKNEDEQQTIIEENVVTEKAYTTGNEDENDKQKVLAESEKEMNKELDGWKNEVLEQLEENKLEEKGGDPELPNKPVDTQTQQQNYNQEDVMYEIMPDSSEDITEESKPEIQPEIYPLKPVDEITNAELNDIDQEGKEQTVNEPKYEIYNDPIKPVTEEVLTNWPQVPVRPLEPLPVVPLRKPAKGVKGARRYRGVVYRPLFQYRLEQQRKEKVRQNRQNINNQFPYGRPKPLPYPNRYYRALPYRNQRYNNLPKQQKALPERK